MTWRFTCSIICLMVLSLTTPEDFSEPASLGSVSERQEYDREKQESEGEVEKERRTEKRNKRRPDRERDGQKVGEQVRGSHRRSEFWYLNLKGRVCERPGEGMEG